MVRRVERDYGRFRQIVKGIIRREQLGKYITNGKLIGSDGKGPVVIPLPQIELPTFRHGRNAPGIGQGDGEPGMPGDGDGDDGDGAGHEPGAHPPEVELTLEELVQIIGERLELPRIKPRDRYQYKDIAQKGPAGLRHFKRSYTQALKRTLASGTYDPEDRTVICTPEDFRYRYPRRVPEPESSAVLIFMRDISGSMDEKRTLIARTEFFWIESWLRRQYRKVETRYIGHDTQAYHMTRDEFYELMAGGGTKISSALEACNDLIKKEFPPHYWNIYPFYISDGDNWGGDDNKKCMELLTEHILPVSNIFCYTQVSRDGSFLRSLNEAFDGDERVASHIVDEYNGEKILGAMKAFLGKGR
jgi:uncharacterized sporulation protein YeaH/YhbH (DUF444 family)